LNRLILFAALIAIPVSAEPIATGQWETSTRIVAMTMPGVPPEMLKAMKGRTFSASNCVRPDDVKAPEKTLMKQSDGKCRYTSFKMANGRISATSVCTGDPAMSGTIDGTYTASSYSMRATMQASNGLKSEMQTDGRRVGSC
jgi:hypothetical protein